MPKVNQKSYLSSNKIKLMTAVINNKIIETEALLNKGVDPNQIVGSNENGLLHLAARYGYLEIASLLLQHGAKETINKKNKLGRTALHEISNTNINVNNEAMALLLLRNEANLFEEDNLKQTPIKLAIQGKNVPVRELFLKLARKLLKIAVLNNDVITVSFLLRNKINLEQEDNITGCTLLHAAAWYGHLEITALLLQHGADIHKTSKIGFTALHYASDNNHKEMAKLLLKFGASLFTKDKQGKTPGSLAANKGYLEIAYLLHPISQPKNIHTLFPTVLKPKALKAKLDPYFSKRTC